MTADGYAVYGYDFGSTDARGYGGMFRSANGIGLYAASDSTLHYNHAGVFHGTGGYGLYVHSSNNNALRAVGGDEGDLSGISQPGGPAAVVGLSGARTGVWG